MSELADYLRLRYQWWNNGAMQWSYTVGWRCFFAFQACDCSLSPFTVFTEQYIVWLAYLGSETDHLCFSSLSSSFYSSTLRPASPPNECHGSWFQQPQKLALQKPVTTPKWWTFTFFKMFAHHRLHFSRECGMTWCQFPHFLSASLLKPLRFSRFGRSQ